MQRREGASGPRSRPQLPRQLLLVLFAVVVGGIIGARAALRSSGRGGTSGAVRCATTVTPETGAIAIASAIASAADGSTVCLATGNYPTISIQGATHSAYVTVRPAPGATVIVNGMEVSNSSFLRFAGLRMTEGFNVHDEAGTASGHDYQFLKNNFDSPLYGIVLEGAAGPIRKVLIEGNYMRHVHLKKPEEAGRCAAGYAQGQDVTMFYAEGVTIARNTFDEAAWHYLQGGAAGPEGITVEHNLFEGHILLACSHLNIWQIFAGGENDTFKDNIAIGDGRGASSSGLSEEAATDGLIFENGPGSLDCSTKMRNTVIEGNLFVDAATSYELQIYTTAGARIRNNTVVGSEYGTALLTEHCGAGSDYTMTHNIDVENGGGADFNFGACTGACIFDYNVSEDSSASAQGAMHYVTDWSPRWSTTAWNQRDRPTEPSGYYIPNGLPIDAGYRGGGGP